LSLFDLFKGPDAETLARQAAAEVRQQQIITAIRGNRLPEHIQARLQASRDGKAPWIATLTPAELQIVRSHGVRPIAAVSASCWLHYGWSWTNGHREGWQAALKRLREEARAAGANAVLDVKMRTVPVETEHSMDFTLIGTAVHIDSLPEGYDPVIATVPALEFVKLLEVGIVPRGIAIGAEYQWLTDWQGSTKNLFWNGNTEVGLLSQLFQKVRAEALRQLHRDAQRQGSGCLAHIHFSQMFEGEQNEKKAYLGRYIVIATVIDQMGARAITHDFRMCVDMRSGKTPLTGTTRHHQSYESNESEGAI
jgi:uncharacterized protein YbjQ (UPF0145 family)